jgi:hypothetical protein
MSDDGMAKAESRKPKSDGFLYFLPGEHQGDVDVSLLRRRGLGYAFDDKSAMAKNPITGRGPGGHSGVLVADDRRTPGHRTRYDPEAQTWRTVPKTGDDPAWVGIWNASPPTPEILLRTEVIAGRWAELGDGRDWAIPVVRACREDQDAIVGTPAVPCRADLGDNGTFVRGEVLPAYQGIWESLDELWTAVMADFVEGRMEKLDAIDPQVLDAAAAELLAVNYAVGPAEIVLLGLFQHPNPFALRILVIALDVAGYLEIKKKQECDGSSSPDGPAVGTPATDPQSPS